MGSPIRNQPLPETDWSSDAGAGYRAEVVFSDALGSGLLVHEPNPGHGTNQTLRPTGVQMRAIYIYVDTSVSIYIYIYIYMSDIYIYMNSNIQTCR